MVEVESLISDIQQFLEDKQPPYMTKLPRLHPDNLLYRTLQCFETLLSELKEQEEALSDLDDKVDYLEDEIGRLESER